MRSNRLPRGLGNSDWKYRCLVVLTILLFPVVCCAQSDVKTANQGELLSETQRLTSVEKSIDWLLDFLSVEREISASDGNSRAKLNAVIMLTGYLLEANPDLLAEDPRRKQALQKAEQLIGTGGVDAVTFTCWRNGFTGIYLCEKSARREKPHRALSQTVESTIRTQNVEGGWAHGSPLGMVDFYPATLIAMSNLSLITLGCAAEFGDPVCESTDYQDVVEAALAMYKKAQAVHGGLPYGAGSYRKGIQSGRTASSIIGLAALSQTNTDLFRRAAYYSVTNTENVPYGHASPAMHVGLGGIAFAILGGTAWEDYNRHVLAKLIRSQKDDGSYSDFVPGSPDSMDLMGDSTIATAYMTVMYAIAMSAERGAFVQRMAKKVDLPQILAEAKRSIALDLARDAVANAGPPKPLQVWRYGKITSWCSDRVENSDHPGLVAIVTGRRNVKFINVVSGDIVHSWDFETELEEQAKVHLVDNKLVVVTPPVGPTSSQQNAPSGHRTDEIRQAALSKMNTTVCCFDIATGEQIWSSKVFRFEEAHWQRDRLTLLSSFNGRVLKLDMSNGKELAEHRSVGTFINTVMAPSSDNGCIVGGLYQIVSYDDGGKPIWKRRLRGTRGVLAPTAQSMLVMAGKIYASCTYGVLHCLDEPTGKLLWKQELGTIAQLVVLPNQSDRVFAIGDDGLIHAISVDENPRNHRILWSAAAGGGKEKRVGTESESTSVTAESAGKSIVAFDRISGVVRILDADTGKVEFRMAARSYLIAGNHVIIDDGESQHVVAL